MPRSRTEVVGVTVSAPTRTAVVGIWCCRRELRVLFRTCAPHLNLAFLSDEPRDDGQTDGRMDGAVHNARPFGGPHK